MALILPAASLQVLSKFSNKITPLAAASLRKYADCKSDACCGVRQDCKQEVCKVEKPECWYATKYKYPCIPFKMPLRCEWNPCLRIPLLDWLYYRTSDKAKRQYQKTWKTCPPMKKRKCCMSDIPEFPPMKRRNRSEVKACRPPTACEANQSKFAMVCRKKVQKSGCPYVEAPCCAVGRKPPSCQKNRGLSDCLKRCCPYPAYSECCVAGFANLPGRSPHCACLQAFLCEAVRAGQSGCKSGDK